MKKVQITETTTKLVELDIEYPVYLYWQDENALGETYVMVQHDYSITIETDVFEVNMKLQNGFYPITKQELDYHKSEKEEFENAFSVYMEHFAKRAGVSTPVSD